MNRSPVRVMFADGSARRPRPLPRLLAALLLVTVSAAQAQPASASAAPPPTGTAALVLSPNWASLTPQQREVLAPLEKDWEQFDESSKGKWMEIAVRYPKLPSDHQRRLRERMVEWSRMSPAQRQSARVGYQRASELKSEDQQSRLRAKWDAYQALSPEERQKLAERAAEKTPRRTGASGVASTGPSHASIRRDPLPVSTAGPTVVQALPGATTVLMTQRLGPPLPAVASASAAGPLRSPRESRLDPHTLLPRPPQATR